MFIEKYVSFWCFNLYWETYGLHHFLNRFVIFIKTPWCLWITFIKESQILLICPFSLNIRLNNCLQLWERSSILIAALQILRNPVPMLYLREHFAMHIGAVKWHLIILKPKLSCLSNNVVWNSPFSMQM